MSNIYITGENTVYKIPLDSIDLGLRPLNDVAAEFNDCLKPFWSSNKFNQKEYFEFEIKAEVRSEESDSKESVDCNKPSFYSDNTKEGIEGYILHLSDVQKCHICNVNVPKMYYLQHMSSNKHKVYTKIANEAMERIKKHMNEINEFNMGTISKSTYFCESCVVIVSNKDKINHETSETHFLCMKQDQVIKDLSELYVHEINISFNTDKVKCEENKVFSETSTEKLNSRITLGNELKTATKIKKHKTSHFPNNDNITEADSNYIEKHTNGTKYNTNLKNHIYCEESEDFKTEPKINKNPQDKSNSSLKAYIKHVTLKKPALHSLQFLNATQIGIKTENGDRVKIPVDHFHSFINVSNKANVATKFCKLCRQILKTHNELEAHKYTEAHIKNIMSPIRDGHSIRKVQNSLWSHCTLCNQLIATKDVHAHVLIQVHIDHLKDALISDIGNTSIILEAQTELNSKPVADEIQIFNDTIHTEENNAETNTKTYIEIILKKIKIGHSITVIDENFICIKTTNGDKITVHINNFHSYSNVNDNKIVYCKLCSAFLKGREKESHKYTMQHINHVMLPIKDVNCIRRLTGIWSHCMLCDERVATVDITSHLSTQKHCQNKETTIVHLNTDKKVNVTSSKSIAKNENEFECDQVTNKNKKVNETEQTVCKKEFMNDNLIEYIKFINGKVKSTHSVTALDENYIQLKAVNGDVIKVHSNNFHSYFNCGNIYTCCLCTITLFDSEIVEHKYTMEHVKRVMSPILNRHCMRELDNGFHCILCNARVSQDCTNDHIQVQTHCDNLKKAFVSIPKTPASEEKKKEKIKINPCVVTNKKMVETYCEVCDLNIQTHNMISHMEGSKHKINEKNKTQGNSTILKTNNSTSIKKSNTKDTHVIHCNMNVDTHNMDSHVNGNRHRLNLDADTVPKKEVIHYQMEHSINTNCLICTVCQVKVPNSRSNVEQHINGYLHTSAYKILIDKNKLTKMNNGFFCNACKTDVPLTTELLHINDKNHELQLTSLTETSVDMKATFCELCKVPVGVNNMATHVIGRKHLKTEKNYSKPDQVQPVPKN